VKAIRRRKRALRCSATTLAKLQAQGERAFISAAGASTADDNIRDQIDYEAQGVVRRNEGFVDRVLSFGGSSGPAAAPLNR
jgi:hypothetical protein